MAPQYPDVVLVLKEWLSDIHEEISQFWIGAEWNMWARYELFMALDDHFKPGYVVNHGVEIWDKGDEQVDVLIEPSDDSTNILAVKVRCERVSENAGSFERFRDNFKSDMVKIKELGVVQNSFEGAGLLLVGFSGPPTEEPDEVEALSTNSKIQHFSAGEVNCWVMKYDLPSKK